MNGGTTELLVFFVAGLSASGHCVGMCGPFALLVGGGRASAGKRWSRQLAFAAGRLSTYGFLGALAGLGGQQMLSSMGQLPRLQAALALVAAAMMLGTALAVLGLSYWKLPSWLSGSCGIAPALRSLLQGPSLAELFAAGVFNGFVPCGIVYAMLALAWQSHHPWLGSLEMLAFGLGTLPAMTLTGTAGAVLSARLRICLVRAAAVLLAVAAGLTALRGVWAWERDATSAPACPLCHEAQAGSSAGLRGQHISGESSAVSPVGSMGHHAGNTPPFSDDAAHIERPRAAAGDRTSGASLPDRFRSVR